MEREELGLTPKEKSHRKLMVSILSELSDSPVVLKGGTALMLCYGLDRFSEDLDFDSPIKLNLASKIKNGVLNAAPLLGVDVLKNTDTVTRYRVVYMNGQDQDSLKLEISYRTPAPLSEVTKINGIRCASLARIIDQKLQAAYDGADPRTKIRDLYDLDFIARKFPYSFTTELSKRLFELSMYPDELLSRYRDAYLEDELVRSRVSLDDLVLRLHCGAEEVSFYSLEKKYRIEGLPSLLVAPSEASHVFCKLADKAIKDANNDPYAVNWESINELAIRKFAAYNECSTGRILEVLFKHSPGAISKEQQNAIRSFASEITLPSRINSTARRVHSSSTACDVDGP